jgi:hypothetical protein
MKNCFNHGSQMTLAFHLVHEVFIIYLLQEQYHL